MFSNALFFRLIKKQGFCGKKLTLYHTIPMFNDFEEEAIFFCPFNLIEKCRLQTLSDWKSPNLSWQGKKPSENNVGKGENADNQQRSFLSD